MTNESKGISLDPYSNYYDLMAPAEKSGFRKKQMRLITLQEGDRVLDVGCGTGAMSILAKHAVGDGGEVQGVDIAPKMVQKSRKKAVVYDLSIGFSVASIDELPFSDEHFDVIISSMMFHHLPVPIKQGGLKECHRVMKEGGNFYLSDFCTPRLFTAPLMALMFLWRKSTRFQLLGKLPGLMEASGYRQITLLKKGAFLKYYRLSK
ncbi:MAG: class I SAM-dependent methyltransferase [Deltaproteobacteria bacterium]|nr:class I SAM-dependent methyltransferase [Deltaproteobacteria bacterium]